MSTSRGQLRHLRRIVERARREQRQLALDRCVESMMDVVRFHGAAWARIDADMVRVLTPRDVYVRGKAKR